MAHLPIITEVFRVTLRWGGGTYPDVHNVFHVTSPTATPADIATALDGSWHNGQFGIVSNNYSVNTYMILPLDGSATTSEFAPDPGNTEGLDGQASGDILFNIAMCLGWLTAQRGPRGRGRLFLGPVSESNVVSSSFNGVDFTALANAWDLWGAAMIAADCTPVVASYAHHDAHPVTGYRANFKPSPLSSRLKAAR
jgi:hypothetical protein